MFIYCTNIYIIQCCHHLLCQPYIFVLIPHFYAVLLIADRGHISQILRRTGADAHFIFLFIHTGILLFPFQILIQNRHNVAYAIPILHMSQFFCS